MEIEDSKAVHLPTLTLFGTTTDQVDERQNKLTEPPFTANGTVLSIPLRYTLLNCYADIFAGNLSHFQEQLHIV